MSFFFVVKQLSAEEFLATIARGFLPTAAQLKLPIFYTTTKNRNSRDNELVVDVVFQEEAQLQQTKHIGDNCDQSLV